MSYAAYTTFVNVYEIGYNLALKIGLELAPMRDGGEEFYGVRCHGTDPEYPCWSRDRYKPYPFQDCKAKQMHPRWSTLRLETAKIVFAEIKKDGSGPNTIEDILTIIQRTVKCERCARRLAHAFYPPIQQFRSITDWYRLCLNRGVNKDKVGEPEWVTVSLINYLPLILPCTSELILGRSGNWL